MSLFKKYSEYYKSANEKFLKMIGQSTDIIESNEIKYEFYKQDNRHIAEIKKDTKVLFRCEYEVIGYYNIINSTWTWVWDNPFIEKSIGIDKTIFTDLKKNLIKTKFGSTQEELEKIIYFIDNPSFYISSSNINTLVQFASYNINSNFILVKKDNNNKPSVLEFISVKDILSIK